VIARGRVHILDSLGLALSGARSRSGEIARDHVASLMSADHRATVLGTEVKTAPRLAAFVNGTTIHADNFDDTNPQPVPHRNGGIHASGPVLAAALAAAEAAGVTGAEFEAAFHVGAEIACKLNHSIATRHYEGGFHTTGTLTVFGAAAACGRIMSLDAAGVSDALAIAASRAGGVRRNFGSMTEQTHGGHSAECGLAAADLAVRGLGGADEILEGRFGYFDAAGGGWEEGAIRGRLGAPWAFVDPGTWIKPYPSGALTHPAMSLALDLARRNDIIAERIAKVRVRTNRRMANTLIHNRPENALEAKFSMPFCVAIMLVEGRAGLAEFTDETVQRADLRDLVSRIDYSSFDTPGEDYTNVTTLLEIELAGGEIVAGRADFAPGSTADPMHFADVAKKFLGCADHAGWPEDKAARAIELVERLGELDDISALTQTLSAPGG
jgi:2-methylcitrate dehydratase PrpD